MKYVKDCFKLVKQSPLIGVGGEGYYGSSGAYTEDLKLYDVVLAESAYSESNYAKAQSLLKNFMEYVKYFAEKAAGVCAE